MQKTLITPQRNLTSSFLPFSLDLSFPLVVYTRRSLPSTMLAARTMRLTSLQPCCPSRGGCGPASTSAPSSSLAAVPRREHRRRRLDVFASAASSSSSSSPEPSDASPSPAQSSAPQMSLAEAHSALGVAEGSKFDLVSAKNRALADAMGDGEKLAKVRFN